MDGTPYAAPKATIADAAPAVAAFARPHEARRAMQCLWLDKLASAWLRNVKART